jgi:peptidyl-prolyl cis-trans isomerase SurA
MKLSLRRLRAQSACRPLVNKKAFLLVLILACVSYTASAQTLFTYGPKSVSADEFLRAYNKNNNDSVSSGLSKDEYLELFIRFKLKVQAALDAGLDTTAEQKAELQSFRQQLADNFIREDASIDLLVEEALQRTMKDIHLSHIYIPLHADTPDDSAAAAEKQINEAYASLKKGESFNNVASRYSHGTLGFITSFVLPYEFESIAYSLKPGEFSAPFRNPSGFHIIRNDYERDAVGKIRAAQILIAYTPGISDAGKEKLKQRADSIYNALVQGADFAEMARQFSDDHLTFFSGGEMPAFGVGQYDTVFENAAFGLQEDGDISKPVATNFGYHIIRRLQRVPVPRSENKAWKQVIRERVLQSDRMKVAHDKLIQSIRGMVAKDASTDELSSDSAVLEFYRNNLEKYNPGFADQLDEFRQGNLLFSIMQRKVWDAAAEDTAGLRAYYEQNRSKYNWENSADALIVTSLVADSVEGVQEALKRDYNSWREIVDKHNSLVQIDSGRFELSQIPVLERTNFTEGLITAPVINEPDSSRTFTYIIKMHEGKSPKSFADSRGAVINDYQAALEEKWIAELKRKYPVKVNRKVFARLKGERR